MFDYLPLQAALLLSLCSQTTHLEILNNILVDNDDRDLDESESLSSHFKELWQDAGHLRKLTIRGAEWGTFACESIARYLPNLTELDLSDGESYPGSQASHLAQLTSLASLKLDILVPSATLRPLLSALTQLHTLHLPGHPVLYEAEVDNLLAAPSLRNLKVLLD
jgi:hypothetical protein